MEKNTETAYSVTGVQELTEHERAAFFANLQRAVILSLEERKILTRRQTEDCIFEMDET